MKCTCSAVATLVLVSLWGCGSSDANNPQNNQTNTQTQTSTATGTATQTSDVKLYINELQPANKDTIVDENNEADDWIEIYNPGTTDIDLKDFTASDSSHPQKIPSSLIVPAGGYVLLWADDSPEQGVRHLGFKLSAESGDSFTLSDPSGAVVDTVTFGADPDKNSYARYPDGTGPFSWCNTPTPAVSNGTACGG